MKGVANIKCVSAIYLCSTIKKQKTMVDINDVIWAFEQGEIEKERLKKSDGAKRDGKGGASS